MKKLLMIFSLAVLSGCYSSYPPAQDTYVETYTVPAYYTDSVQTVYSAQPSTTYIIEQNSPDVVYINSAPDYVFLPNPLIYGRPHHPHHYYRPVYHRHYAPSPRPHGHHHLTSSPHHGGHSSSKPSHGHNSAPHKPRR